jgi:carbon monoxide dehydrogenase subunit G
MILTYNINKPLETVFEYLTNMQKFVTVHPIIYKIEDKGQNEYLVFEKLKILFIPVSFTYPAKVEGNIQTRQIKINAVVKKMTHIQMHFDLANDNGKTRITETIDFMSPLPLKGTMEKIFKKQHNELFKNIELA